MEHAELIESAFVNYLSGIRPSPWSDGLLIFPGENNLDKSGARIVAYVPEDGVGEEDPPLSGNRICDVVIELRTPFSKLTAKDIAAKATQPLVVHQLNADALQAALLSTTLPDDISAAIPGLSVWGIIDRKQMREQKANYWGSGWTIKMLSCPASF
jgi:hypothetical protein